MATLAAVASNKVRGRKNCPCGASGNSSQARFKKMPWKSSIGCCLGLQVRRAPTIVRPLRGGVVSTRPSPAEPDVGPKCSQRLKLVVS